MLEKENDADEHNVSSCLKVGPDHHQQYYIWMCKLTCDANTKHITTLTPSDKRHLSTPTKALMQRI